MSSTPLLPKQEVLYWDEDIISAKKEAMLRREQKGVSWVEALVRKSSRHRDAMIYFCGGTCFVAKAGMLFD